MRKVLLLFGICITLFSCNDFTEREYEVIFENGEKAIIKTKGGIHMEKGCIASNNIYVIGDDNISVYACGVRSYKLIK